MGLGTERNDRSLFRDCLSVPTNTWALDQQQLLLLLLLLLLLHSLIIMGSTALTPKMSRLCTLLFARMHQGQAF